MDSKLNIIIRSIYNRMQYIPNYKLYKYRECVSWNLEALQQEYIWWPFADSMPDTMDCAVNYYFDIDESRQWFKENGLEWAFYNYIMNEVQKRKLPIPKKQKLKYSFVSATINRHKFNERRLIKELKKYFQPIYVHPVFNCLIQLQNQRETNLTQYDKSINAYKDMLIESKDNLRKRLAVLCLAESYKSNSMWENYSKNNTGFCVEYDFSSCLTNLDNNLWLMSLAPVEYKERAKVSMNNIYDYFLENCCMFADGGIHSAEEGSFERQIYIKDPSYAFEKEWRIFSKDITTDTHKFDFPYASAVYAGCNISDSDLNNLKLICLKLNIPLYKQYLANSGVYAYAIVERD